ncbi:MAG: peptidoglycan DD-metalloendopeptidase family protein [Candidatus Hydrogenedentes bacterium]|nr:peptidoglycan DD-metalloendopeptidase family protein [Candidatus Hydrogenedentota bacterium]
MRIVPITGEQGAQPVPGLLPIATTPPAAFHEFIEKVRSDSSSRKTVTHTVTEGENLWQICRDHLSAQGKKPTKAEIHSAVTRLAKEAGLKNPDRLSVGQKLDLAALTTERPAPTLSQLSSAFRAAPLPKGAEPEQISMPAQKGGPAMPQEKAGLKMPNEPRRVGYGKMNLPMATSRARASAPPIVPHGTSAARALSQDTVVEPAAASRGVDITGLMQSILEPGSFSDTVILPGSPWSKVLGGPARLTSKYGMRTDPFTGRPQFHQGLDIAAKAGTEIYPSMPGKVTFSGWRPGYGKMVIVEHPNGMHTVYGHASKNLVKAGDVVTTDTAIAQVGSTGRATGPHLHFEVRKNDVPVDPLPLFNGDSLHVAQAL